MLRDLVELTDKSLSTSEKVDKIEKAMLEIPQVACPVVHTFGPGVYIREVKIPRGAVAIGHHQNFEHMNVFLQGRVTMLNDDGSTSEMKAPMMFTGKPGRKIGYIHEDVVWLNVYPTDEQDVEKLEAKYLTKSEGFKEHLAEKTRLLEGKITPTSAYECAKLPLGGYKFKVTDSRLYATGDYEIGEIIAPYAIEEKKTIAGFHVGHAVSPNAEIVHGEIVAIKPIRGCHGGLDGEEITIKGELACQE